MDNDMARTHTLHVIKMIRYEKIACTFPEVVNLELILLLQV